MVVTLKNRDVILSTPRGCVPSWVLSVFKIPGVKEKVKTMKKKKEGKNQDSTLLGVVKLNIIKHSCLYSLHLAGAEYCSINAMISKGYLWWLALIKRLSVYNF